MPNRCTNEITIDGPADDVIRIKKYIKKESFFNNFLKRPKDVDWYDWNIANRGTKRDTGKKMMNQYEFTETNNRATLILGFDTARSPPYEAMYYLAVHNPKLSVHLRYSEGGMGFSGEAERSDGEKTYHEEYNDPYFGEGQECTVCKRIYGPEDDDRGDEEHTICHRCHEDKGTQ